MKDLLTGLFTRQEATGFPCIVLCEVCRLRWRPSSGYPVVRGRHSGVRHCVRPKLINPPFFFYSRAKLPVFSRLCFGARESSTCAETKSRCRATWRVCAISGVPDLSVVTHLALLRCGSNDRYPGIETKMRASRYRFFARNRQLQSRRRLGLPILQNCRAALEQPVLRLSDFA